MTMFNQTYDTATPAGTDDPSEADDRMREIKAAVQERLAVDHKFSLTGTEVSASDTGEHVKITFNVSLADPTQVASKAHLYMKDDELVYQDDTNTALPITSGGGFAGGNVNGNRTITGKLDVDGNIDPTTYETTNGGFLNSDSMAGASDNTVASSDSIVKYTTLDSGGVLMHDAEGAFNNADVDSTKTKVYTKYLTGTLDSDSTTNVSHGVSSAVTKILAVTVMAFDGVNNSWSVAGFRETDVTATSFRSSFDATNVIIGEVGSNLQGEAYRVKVDYIL